MRELIEVDEERRRRANGDDKVRPEDGVEINVATSEVERPYPSTLQSALSSHDGREGNAQQTSSSMLTTTPHAFFALHSARTLSILSATPTPAYWTGCSTISRAGRAGRPTQVSSTRLRAIGTSSAWLDAASEVSSALKSAMERRVGSRPMRVEAGRVARWSCQFLTSVGSGLSEVSFRVGSEARDGPGRPYFCRVHSDESSFAACCEGTR